MARERRAPDSPLPTEQTRSQETLERLLTAAELVLRDEGPDGATLRAIADRAGVSVGIVYRRFPDKDTVLRAVYMRFFERSAAANATALRDPRLSAMPAGPLARRLIDGAAAGYRTHRRLLRALLMYARSHEDPEFQRRAEAVNAAAFDGVAKLFESRVREIRHPDPAAAIVFGLRAVGAVLQDCILFDPSGARDTDRMLIEVTRMFLNFLGVANDARVA